MMRRRVIVIAVVVVAGGAGLHESSAQFGFGAADSETKVVARFDKDGDGRLNRDERQAARTALPAGGGAGFGGRRAFGRATAAPGPKMAPADARPYPKTPFYDLGTLRTIFLDFENADWEDELSTFYNTDVEVPATM